MISRSIRSEYIKGVCVCVCILHCRPKYIIAVMSCGTCAIVMVHFNKKKKFYQDSVCFMDPPDIMLPVSMRPFKSVM